MTWKNLSTKLMILALCMSLSHWSFAQTPGQQADEDPSAVAMAADLVIVRPTMFAITAVGSVLWVVSLPFSAAGGNVKQAGDTLVVKPALNTFVRCLGCTKAGYKRYSD